MSTGDRILAVLLDEQDESVIRRSLESLRLQWPAASITVAAPARYRPHYATCLPAVELFEERDSLAGFAAVVIVEHAEDPLTARLEARGETTLYRVENFWPIFQARIQPLDRDALLPEQIPHRETHLFNTLGPKGTDTFQYFPYGFLHRTLGLGPTNELGFRTALDLRELEDRDPDHVLVCVFGGSGAFGIATLHTEMFSTLLEQHLNAASEAAGRARRFTVVNLAQPGAVVLNEMLAYLLFCHRLRPELVIAHDGFNDLSYGSMTCRHLLDEWDLTYCENLEAWGELLHGTKQPEWHQNEFHKRPRNLPQSLARAHRTRKEQFRRVVEAHGGAFVWGIQPYLQSKGTLSPAEETYLASPLRRDEAYDLVFRKMSHAYEELSGLGPPDDALVVDLHAAFGELGSEATHFVDFVHTSPEGDAAIAGLYADTLIPWIAGGALERRPAEGARS